MNINKLPNEHKIPDTITDDCQFFVETMLWQCPRKGELHRCIVCGTYICMTHYEPLTKLCKQCVNKGAHNYHGFDKVYREYEAMQRNELNRYLAELKDLITKNMR